MRALQVFVKLFGWSIFTRILPALLLVACSGLPAQEQGATRRRPVSTLASASILERFATEVPEIQSVYASVTRRLSTSELAEMEKLLSDVNDRKDIVETKAHIALSGLQLSLVLLPVQRADSARYWRRLRNIREMSIFYGPELMGKLSRTPVDTTFLTLDNLALESSASKSPLERLESSIEVLSIAARGAGLELGKAAAITSPQKELSGQFDDVVKTVSVDVFSVVVPAALSASLELEKSGPVESKMLEKVVLNVTLQAVSVAKLLTGALDEGKIDKPGIIKAVDEWAASVVQTAKQSPTDMLASTSSQTNIPKEIPNLDPLDGRYNGTLGTWLFVGETPPLSGQLDLSRNPPVYEPGANFDLSDKYSFKLCHKDYASLCSPTFVKTVYRPMMMDIVSLKTTGRGLLPNSEAVCEVGAKELRTAFYSWFSRASAPGSPVLQIEQANSRILKNTGIPRATIVWCEVSVSDEFGLLSPALPSQPVVIPNAWPQQILSAKSSADVDEDTRTEISLGQFLDEDGDLLNWTMITPPTRGSVDGITTAAVSPATGSLNYQSNSNDFGPDSFTYKICDNQQQPGCSDTLTMNINVKPVNDVPNDIQLSSDSIEENSSALTPIGILTTADADPTDTFTYSISGQDAEYLVVQGNVLKSSKSIDFETKQQLQFDVTSTDNGGLSFTKTFTVQVLNVNESPFDIQLSSINTAENKPINSLLGFISSSDPDAFSAFSYSLSGPDAQYFQIYGSMLVTKSLFNFENRNSYEISITTRDQFGLNYTKSFIIGIDNINETPTGMSLSTSTIQENKTSGSVVGVLSAIDEDTDEIFSFTLKGSDAGNFALISQGKNAQIITNTVFNFEERNSYSITAQVADKSGANYEKAFSISVTDINENPVVVVTQQEVGLDEDGSVEIPLRVALDSDAGSILEYQTTNPAHGAIEPPLGNPTQGAFMRYTPQSDFNGTDTFTYRVCDQGGLCSEFVPVAVTVRAVNDAPKFSSTLSSQTVSEDNVLGPLFFTIDDIDSNISCANVSAASNLPGLIPNENIVIGGADSKNCSITMTPQLDKNSLNAGGSPEITLTLQDQLTSVSLKFYVTVTPVNDAPRDIQLSNNTIAENNSTNAAVGQFTSVDPDLANTFTYSLGGPSAGLFSMSGNTLIASSALDHESAAVHNLTVTTTDQSGSQFSKAFLVQVSDVNESPTNISLSRVDIDENLAAGTTVATLGTTDPDAGESFTYVVGGIDAASFVISENSLKTNATYDFETKAIYNISIMTRDNGNLTFVKAIQISVNDMNEQPTDISLSNSTILESAVSGTVVGTLATSDPDNSNIFSYSVSGTDAAAFSISGPALVTNNLFDFEAKSNYIIAITTTDQNGAQLTKPFTISIANVNESPNDISLSNNLIGENLPHGSLVGTLSSVDQDIGNTFSYTISGTDAAAFSMDGNSLKTSVQFNFEQKSNYQINITTYDQGLLQYSEPFTISVTDLNEQPTDIILSSNTIPENAAPVSVIGNLSTLDPDTASAFNYTLGGEDSQYFTINGNILSSSQSFDFERKQSYNITVTSKDIGDLSLVKSFTIAIQDVNEAPTNIQLTNSTVPENFLQGGIVGQLITTDPDHSDAFIYTLGGVDAAAFEINSNQLKTSIGMDFENKPQLHFSITTTDKGGATFTRAFTLQVTNVNEQPTDILLSGNSIVENSTAGTVVGNLATVDPDTSGTFTYSLSGSDASFFRISGNKIVSDTLFDFETKNSFAVTVTSQDQGALSVAKSFTIAVTNANEAPTDITLLNSNADENSPLGTLVGSISTTDPDALSAFTYSLSGPDAGMFSVSGTNLVTSAGFDFELKNSFTIAITATDQSSLAFTKQFTIMLNDLNEAPQNIALSVSTVPENSPLGTVVGIFSTEDQDLNNTFTYLISGSDEASFEISGALLKTKASLNFEAKSLYAITVTTTDQSGASFAKPFIITVLDQNDAPTGISLSNATIAENSTVGAFIGSLNVSDPDTSNTFTFILGGPDAEKFLISGNSLSSAAAFDFESKSTYSLDITARDQGGLTFSQNFQINITNTNEAPSNINLSSTSVEENRASGTLVANVSTVDVDAGNLFVYSLSGADAGAFTLTGNSLFTNVVYNFEAKSSYSIRLMTTDQDGLSYSKDFTISVVNVNEVPTDVTLSSNTVPEIAPVGTLVGSLSTVDPDILGTFTYSIGGPDASSFVVSGNSLATTQLFNFENKSSYTLTVQSQDQGGLTVSKNIVVSILDSNESPVDISLANATISENLSAGSLIGGLSTTDPDSGNSFTYSLSGPDAGAFSIIGSLLRSDTSFDFESKNQYTVFVTSTDNTGAAFAKAFNISVTDVNEAPVNILFSGGTIAENIISGASIGTFTAVDPDALNTFTWSLSGTDASAFNLSGNSLSAAISFNYENKSSYSFTITAQDQQGLSFSKSFSVAVLNVNEAPININITNTTVAENQTVGTLVGSFSTDDPDQGNTFTYTLGGTDATSFYIVGNSLRTSASFNYEAVQSYSITISSKDQGDLQFVKAFTINSQNVNEAPLDIVLSATSIPENNSLNTVVADLTTIDPDAANTFSYSVSGLDASSFSISGSQLQAAASFNFELKNSYSFIITTQDQGGLSFSKTVTITITNVNETATDISSTGVSINENLLSGTAIGNLTTTDPDAANTFTYTLGGTNAAAFAIFGSTLYSAQSFDFEAKSTYSITITTQDQGGLSYTKNFTITVNDLNETPTDIQLSNSSVAENVANATLVGLLTTTDQDSSNTFTYALSGTDAAAFNISSNSLVTAAPLNFETKSSYSFNIISTDQGGLSVSKAFIVTITNVNEAPTDLLVSNSFINENSPAVSLVGTLSTSDVDAGSTFTYALSGTDASFFSVSGASLYTTQTFNFENKSSYSISVTSTDQGGLSFSKALTISVGDINEVPTNISLSVNSVAENQASGTVIGSLTSTDQDTGNTFTYSVGGTDAAAFAISGNNLTTAVNFNYEAKSSYSINITTQDQNSLSFTKAFTILVNNVNEAPTDLSLSLSSIAENNLTGATVATLSTTDVDAGNTFNYTLGGADAAVFSISGNTLLAATSFNYEIKSSYSFNITTQDQGGLSFTKAVVILVTNVNETPTDIIVSANTIPENQSVGTTLGTLTTSDPDAANTFVYTIGGTDAASFTISGSSILTAASFNFETKTSYSIIITSQDQGGLSVNKTFTIGVTNVNESPTNITLSASSLAENNALGATIANLTSADPDASNTFTYSLGGTDAASFSISGSSLLAAVAFNFEAKSGYSFDIITTDQGGLTYTKSVIINITNVNESPTNLSLSASSIQENSPIGTVIGSLDSTDPDASNTFTYSLGGTDAASFAISSNNLTSAIAFNFESKLSYSFTITTTDQGGLTFTKNFSVTINDINESPTNITLSNSTINENIATGSVVGTLSTSDPDAGNTFTYTLSGADASSFVVSSGMLVTNAAIDFETKSSYTLSITSADQGTLSTIKSFTISISNVNESPTDITLSANSIIENNSIGATIATLSTTDVDAGNTFTYGLSGTDAAAFTLIGNTLSAALAYNFESKTSYSITLTTTDQGNLSFSKNFTISITNMNESPTDITISSSSVAENSPAVTTVGTLASIDPDAANTFTYSVSGTDASSFAISGNSLTAAVAFNFEAKSSYNVTLTTTDQGTLQFSKAFTITIVNANDAPTSISISGATIAENNALNAVIGTISGVDPDALDTLTFSVSGGTDATAFNVSGTSLRASSAFDFETKNSYNVTLRATDAAGATFDSPFTISITNVNEAPVTAGGDTSKITSEDTSVTILLASATDQDAGNTMSYLIFSPSNGTLGLPTGNPNIGGSIPYAPNLNFNGSDSFSYSVCDNATPSLCSASRTVSLSITAVNDAPTISAVSNQTINEDSNTGALSFTVGDVDSSVNCSQVTATSSITTLIPNANLSLAGGTGTSCTITATPAANKNNVTDPGAETITLSLTDSSSATTTQSFTVTVNPANDAPTMNVISAQSVNMNTNLAVGFVVDDIDGALACSSTYLSYSSSTPSIVATSGAVAWSGTWPNCVGTVTPVNGAFGAVNLTFQVTDAATATASRTFQLTVNDTRAATAPTISGAASVSSNVTNFVLSGTCTAGYTVDVSGDVSISDMVSPFQSLSQSCPSNGNYSFTIAKSLDGQYVFRVAQTNPFNPVQSTSISKIWTRDTVAPTGLVLSTPTENPTNSRSGTFTFMGSCEASATVNLSATVIPSSIVVSPLSTTCSSSGSFSFSQSLGADGNAASDGTYNYTLSQTDAAANTSASLSFVWVKDSAIPTTPVISTPTRNAQGIYYTNSSTSTTYPNISVTCTASNDVTLLENGTEIITGTCGSTTAGTYSYQVPARTDGTYRYSIYQTDTTLGKSSAVASFTWIRDILAPASPVFTNPSSSSITSPNSLYMTGTCETNATVTILVGGVADSSTTCIAGAFAATVSRSVAGTYSITARQTDPAGNISATSVAKSWTQDPNSVPIPTVTFPSTGTIINNASSLNILGVCQPTYPITIAAGSGTTLTGGEITNPPGAFVQNCAADGTFSYTIAKSSDGIFNFNITQQIVSGGTSSVAAPVSWTRDTVAPTVTITASSANAYSANAYFDFSVATDSVAGYQCSTDNLTYISCTTPYSLALATSTNPKAANGVAKTLYVRATDTAQNTGASTSVTWTPTVNFASLLYHFDNNGTNSSLYNATVPSNITTTGATFVTANAGFGTHALSLAANTPLTLADNTILGSFLSTATIEFMFNTGNTTATNVITQQSTATTGVSWAIKTVKISMSNYKFSFTGSTNGTTLFNVNSTCNLGKNAWHHVAITFNAGNVTIYCNGTASGTGTVGTAGQARLFDTTAAMGIGGTVAFKIDELRISQGLRYTGNFTAPTAAFSTAD
jgi:hypothetical protein